MYAVLLAATNGCFDRVPVEKIKAAESSLLRDLKAKHGKLVDQINTGAEPDEKDKDVIVAMANDIAKAYEPVKEETK